MKTPATIHTDSRSGVNYQTPLSWEEPDSLEFRPVQYERTHLPSGSRHGQEVYVRKTQDPQKLIDSWNSQGQSAWRYRLI